MDFVTWSYGVETIADNIKKFQEKYPDITVTHKDYSWLDYPDTMVGLFTTGGAPELVYGSDHWLQQWASAGWLEPLDEHCPNVATYNQEVAPYAKQGMTYDGKTYGLSYYADTMDFVYNETLTKKAGFDKAPETWDDVYNQAKAIKEQGTLWVRLTYNGQYAVTSFEDSGCGISPEHLHRIFDPFFTTKPEGQGTGLGLSVSYGIIASHGGQIEVNSEVGKGSTFTVYLPLAQSAQLGEAASNDA